MNKIDICTQSQIYPIYICDNYNNFNIYLDKIYEGQKCILITDETVNFNQSQSFEEVLKFNNIQYKKIVLPDGENSKSLKQLENVYTFLHDNYVERNSIIIGLGGGMIGDLCGFVASTYLRGIRYINVPTSLIAQVDSSIGGKTGINFKTKKNLIGSFYPPEFIYTNVEALSTLPERHFKSGLAECLCHSLINGKELFDFIKTNIRPLLELEKLKINQLIEMNCKIKKKFVERDPYDKNCRRLLNLGHTFGHAIESAYYFELTHGESVALGIICSFRLSYYMGIVSKKDVELVIQLIYELGLPINLEKQNDGQVFKRLFYDKKVKNNNIQFILPRQIGEVMIEEVKDFSLISKVIDQIYHKNF